MRSPLLHCHNNTNDVHVLRVFTPRFQHNAVSPFGVALPAELPVVVAAAALGCSVGNGGALQLPPPGAFLWFGGGHPDLKVGCSAAHFVKALTPLVADISDPR